MSEIELSVGDYVEKVSGYRFTGTVVSAFETLAGKRRVVVDNGDGMLHIFNEGQMRPATRSQSERVSRLEEALKPFARLAGPINGEEGRPTYLEAISGPNGTDELKLETYVGDGTRFEVMDAEDFRRARYALNQGADDGR